MKGWRRFFLGAEGVLDQIREEIRAADEIDAGRGANDGAAPDSPVELDGSKGAEQGEDPQAGEDVRNTAHAIHEAIRSLWGEGEASAEAVSPASSAESPSSDPLNAHPAADLSVGIPLALMSLIGLQAGPLARMRRHRRWLPRDPRTGDERRFPRPGKQSII